MCHSVFGSLYITQAVACSAATLSRALVSWWSMRLGACAPALRTASVQRSCPGACRLQSCKVSMASCAVSEGKGTVAPWRMGDVPNCAVGSAVGTMRHLMPEGGCRQCQAVVIYTGCNVVQFRLGALEPACGRICTTLSEEFMKGPIISMRMCLRSTWAWVWEQLYIITFTEAAARAVRGAL
eukprot:1148663-Pelagomonas_calceolata.AAC.13